MWSLDISQVLVTDFFGSVMGIKHTEAAYLGFTGLSADAAISTEPMSSSNLNEDLNVPIADATILKEVDVITSFFW